MRNMYVGEGKERIIEFGFREATAVLSFSEHEKCNSFRQIRAGGRARAGAGGQRQVCGEAKATSLCVHY